MTDHKFTDDEIIKALYYCLVNLCDCSQCPRFDKTNLEHCHEELYADTLALINRQKASIQEVITLNSKLEAENARLQRLLDFYEETSGNKKAKTEAIKEFARALQAEAMETDKWGKIVLMSDVRAVVKKLTEDQK